MALTIEFGGKNYIYDPASDITLSALRHIKQWYPDLCSFNKLVTGFADGDPDAIACVIWIMRRKAGETNVPEPRNMEDFAIADDFYAKFAQTEEPVDPTQAGSDLLLDQTPV